MNISLLAILSALSCIIILLARKKLSALIPEAVRRKSPLILGGLGIIFLLYNTVNTVLHIRHSLAGDEALSPPNINLPSLPLDKTIANISNMDCHLVLIESNGSLLPQDWTVQQWRTPCQDGFKSIPLGSDSQVSMDKFYFHKDSVTYPYSISEGNSSSSGSPSISYDHLLKMHPLTTLNQPSKNSITLVGTPRSNHGSMLYFFFSQKTDPLEPHKLSFLSGPKGFNQYGDYLAGISIPSTSWENSKAPGLRWLDWMGLGVVILLIASFLIGKLLPWKQGYAHLCIFVLGIFITIALDRWSVGYATEVAANAKNPPFTRYLAMQQLRSSFFWRDTARKSFDAANTDGFGKETLDRINTQHIHFD